MSNKNMSNSSYDSSTIVRITLFERKVIRNAIQFILNNTAYHKEKEIYYIKDDLHISDEELFFTPEELIALKNFLGKIDEKTIIK